MVNISDIQYSHYYDIYFHRLGTWQKGKETGICDKL